MRLRIIFLLLAGFFSCQLHCSAEVLTLAKGDYSSKSMQIQQFAGKISLDQVDNSMPLTLNFTNGKFAWVQVFLTDQTNMSPDLKAQPRGMLIINPASFKTTSQVSIDVTGRLRRGVTVLLVRGAGVPGSTFSWNLTTVTGLKITSVEPKIVQAGGMITLGGAGYSTIVTQNIVMFNNTKAKVIDATGDSIKAMVPDTLTAGNYAVTITSAGSKSNPVNIKVRGLPEITNVGAGCVKSSLPFQIYGKNFSDVTSDNIVMVGAQTAKVDSATTESLTVIMPFFPEAGEGALWFNPPRQFDITVKVNNVQAKGKASIYCGPYPW